MTNADPVERRDLRRIARTGQLLAIAGTAVLGASLLWNLDRQRLATHEIARAEARSAIREDNLHRRWNVEHGGVYLRTTEQHVLPDGALVEDGELESLDGERLQLVHHIGMTRLVHGPQEGKGEGTRGHITSLHPLRRHNAPDAWERGSLLRFAEGAGETCGLHEIDGHAYMRVMRPLRTEEGCLACHGAQGHRVGDIRGGVVFSVPMASLRAISAPVVRELVWVHALLWIVGLIAVAWGVRTTRRTAQARLVAERERTSALAQLEGQNQILRTQRRDLEAQARTLAALVDSLEEGVFLLDAAGSVVIANETAGRLIGKEGEELVGRPFPDLTDNLLDDDLRRAVDAARARPDADLQAVEQVPGYDRLYTVAPVVVPEDTTPGVLIVVQDLSRLRALESEREELSVQLHHQEKLAIVGILASNLAYELNSPLGVIMLQIQRGTGLYPSGEMVPILDIIEREVGRCRDTVRRLMDFAHVGGRRPALLDLAEPIEQAVRFAGLQLRPKGVTIEVTRETDVPRVHADASQLEQVLLNLIGNAGDALSEGGVVEVRQRRVGSEVLLEVADRGRGIDPALGEKVLEPFFTTKPAGKGTGLGLPICKRLVEEHRGRLELAPREGGGTVARVFLPIAR